VLSKSFEVVFMEQMQLFAGLDMHTASITGTIKDETGTPVRVLKVDTSKEGVKRLFDRLQKKNITAVFEASRNWPYYVELLQPYCNKVIMAHPLKIRAIASARIKTDAIDSNTLSDLLRANLIPESYMPELNFVQLRELLRYTANLSNLRGQLKTKAKAILSREGKKCDFDEVTGKRARLWLKNLVLNDLNRKELDYTISLIDNLSSQITELNKTIEKEQYNYPEIDLLKSIPGIGTFSAMMIIAEIVNISRFETPNKLASYAGLVPSTYQSSQTQYSGRITKRGSKWLRWILTQCSHASVKTRNSHKLKSFYLRIERKKGKQKAMVATARKMLVIIWFLLNKNEYYAYRDGSICANGP
jgi:transposase